MESGTKSSSLPPRQHGIVALFRGLFSRLIPVKPPACPPEIEAVDVWVLSRRPRDPSTGNVRIVYNLEQEVYGIVYRQPGRWLFWTDNLEFKPLLSGQVWTTRERQEAVFTARLLNSRTEPRTYYVYR